MYKFELADGAATSVNYRALSSNYTKSRIYASLLFCSLILCVVVHFLVVFLTKGSSINSYATSTLSVTGGSLCANDTLDSTYDNYSESNTSIDLLSHKELKEVDISNHSYDTADVISTSPPSFIYKFRGSKIVTANRSGHVGPPEHTSSRTTHPIEGNTNSSSSAFSVSQTFVLSPTTEVSTQSVGVSPGADEVMTQPSSLSNGTHQEPGSADVQCGKRSVETPSYGRSEGINTYFGEFPWMLVLLNHNLSGENTFKCGASLIASDVALTAAHCVSNQYGLRYVVRAGDWYLDDTLRKEFLPPQERDVLEIQIHPDFSAKTLENNIALLKLSAKFVYDDHIRPICLPDWNIQTVRENCVVTGWGKDSSGDTTHHEFLRQVGLSLVPEKECEAQLRRSGLGQYYTLSPGELCALNASSSVSSCKGDGGGPLVCTSSTSPDLHFQVGISTWSLRCAPEVPGLYTNVEFHRDWIDRTVTSFGEALDTWSDSAHGLSVRPEEERSG